MSFFELYMLHQLNSTTADMGKSLRLLRNKQSSGDAQVEDLRQERIELSMFLASLVNLLVSKGLVTADEINDINASIDRILAEKGPVDDDEPKAADDGEPDASDDLEELSKAEDEKKAGDAT
jgi:hypothetical protein